MKEMCVSQSCWWKTVSTCGLWGSDQRHQSVWKLIQPAVLHVSTGLPAKLPHHNSTVIRAILIDMKVNHFSCNRSGHRTIHGHKAAFCWFSLQTHPAVVRNVSLLPCLTQTGVKGWIKDEIRQKHWTETKCNKFSELNPQQRRWNHSVSGHLSGIWTLDRRRDGSLRKT